MRQPLQAAAPAARPAFAEDDMLDEVNLDDRTRTINCSNSVNLEIYLNATRCYEFQLHGGSTRAQYDLEVFKLLFALQVRVVEDWASRWEGMLQRLLDEGTASRFLEGRLRQELREQGQLGVFEGRAEQAREGLRSVFQYWHGTSVDERSDTVLTTFEEVNRSRADWPGFASLEQYQARLEELGGTCSLGFLGKKDERLTCQASWRRLCEEFALWGLLLTMPKITDAELASTDPSTGIAMAAGPQERVAKLTRHRLDRLSRKGPAVFKKRLLYLIKRDVEAGLRRLPRSAPPAAPALHAPQPGVHEGAPHATRLGDQDLRNWLEQHLVGFADSVVTEEMGFVKQAYAGLSPFDFCTLNGRSKLDHRALRSQHFELNVAGTAAPKVDAHEVKTALKEAWEAPEKTCWPGLHLTVRTDGAFLAASAETTLALYKNVVERRVERVDEIMNLKLAERPYASQEGGTEYAGGMQHQLLLMFFKVVHVDAINHCRPRLNKMMADMYHQRNLLRALQESPELDYLQIYGPLIAEKRLELEQRESKLAQKRRVLALWGAAPEPLPEPGHGARAGAEAEWPEPEAAEP